MTHPSTRILVLGAGIAGLLFTLRLVGKVERSSVQITLVDESDTFTVRPRLHEFATKFLTPPFDWSDETRAFFHDPDGHLPSDLGGAGSRSEKRMNTFHSQNCQNSALGISKFTRWLADRVGSES